MPAVMQHAQQTTRQQRPEPAPMASNGDLSDVVILGYN